MQIARQMRTDRIIDPDDAISGFHKTGSPIKEIKVKVILAIHNITASFVFFLILPPSD